MKQHTVIKFTKHRYLFFLLSLLLIAGGIVGMVLNGGFNLGIDFRAGLSQRVQIADPAMSVSYAGPDDVSLNLVGGKLVLEVRSSETGVNRTEFSPIDFPTIADLAAALARIDGIEVTVTKGSASSGSITAGINLPYRINADPVVIQTVNSNLANPVTIDAVRSALGSVIGSSQVQVVGDPVLQEFQIRVEAQSEGVKEQLETAIAAAVRAEFGAQSLVVKQSDYVGPKFSNLLTYRSLIMVVVALALIMAYIWFRFRFASALSAIAALAHDILIMLGFIAVLRLEVSTTTIAALLTIIGYSLNDTIVVFDRIRENTQTLKGKTFERIINTSITQSLSRTIITSLTTLLAVLPLFIFAKGSIQLFALNLIVGIVVGTYSSIFIASPVLLAMTNYHLKRKARHLGKDPLTVLAEEVEVTTEGGSQAVLEEVVIPKIDRKLKGKRKK